MLKNCQLTKLDAVNWVFNPSDSMLGFYLYEKSGIIAGLVCN